MNQVTHVDGKKNSTAHGLSRRGKSDADDEEEDVENCVQVKNNLLNNEKNYLLI